MRKKRKKTVTIKMVNGSTIDFVDDGETGKIEGLGFATPVYDRPVEKPAVRHGHLPSLEELDSGRTKRSRY